MEIKTLTLIETPFKDKFGIPRQSGLIPEAVGYLKFPNDNFHRECVRGLESFSHLWLTFIFHKVVSEGERSLVRPPRLGGKEKMGVWATRSPHRPNHLGLTVVKLESIVSSEKQIVLKVSGLDLLDKTPIVDIKPYVEYADSLTGTTSAWVPAPESLKKISIKWDKGTTELLSKEEKVLVEKVLEQDPRPSAQKFDKESYVFNIFNYEIRFKNGESEFLVTSVGQY